MITIEEFYEQLTDVYAVKCPRCGAQWSFRITSNRSYHEIRKCGCKEYRELIDKRYNEIVLRKYHT